MQTQEQVTTEFKAKLKALLEEYGAEVEVTEVDCGYATRVDSIDITVPSIWHKDGNLVRDYTTIVLRPRFDASDL